MANLIKMDLRRLFRSPMFLITLSVAAVFNILLTVGMAMLTKMFASAQAVTPTILSDVVSNPFVLPIFSILMFTSLISFSYADIAGGYIKNLAKFMVIGIHNFIFLAVGSLTNALGNLAMSATGMLQLTDDGKIGAAIMTILLKWLLSMAIAAILLFVTNGVKNKVLATVIGVILGTGTMSLAYMGLNTAISNIFHTQSFDLGMYMPDALFNSVNVGANVAVINAIVVSLVFIVLFMALTVKLFKSRDVK